MHDVAYLMSVDRSYLRPLIYTLRSIVRSKNIHPVYIINSANDGLGLGQSDCEYILRNVTELDITFLSQPPGAITRPVTESWYFSSAMWNKYFHWMLPAKKVIWLDSDVLLVGDFRPAWDRPIPNFAIAVEELPGVLRNFNTPAPLKDFGINPSAVFGNAGIMIFNNEVPNNLRYWEEIQRLYIKYSDTLILGDQGLVALMGATYAPTYLTAEYNFPFVFYVEGNRRPIAAVHYWGQPKPWQVEKFEERYGAIHKFNKTYREHMLPELTEI